MEPSGGSIPEPTRVFRAYNPNADYHFFTTSEAEFENAVAHGYRDETTFQAGFSVLPSQASGAATIHRLYNLESGRHYYTFNSAERDFLVSLVPPPASGPDTRTVGWRYEKDEGFIFPNLQSGASEIFRLYNNNSGVHLYTENAGYKDQVLAQFPGIWVQHSSFGFAYPETVALPVLNGISSSSAQPGSLLTLSGSNFDPETQISVQFSDGEKYTVLVPATEVSTNSLTVGVPAYFNTISTLTPEPVPVTTSTSLAAGTVSVKVVEIKRNVSVSSSAISSFQIQNLPTLVAPAGTVTLSLLRASKNAAIQLQTDIRDTPFDTASINAGLATQLANIDTLIANVQTVVQNPGQTFNLGTIDGQTLTVGISNLQHVDRIAVGMFRAIGATGSALPAVMEEVLAPASVTTFASASNDYAQAATQTSMDVGPLADVALHTRGFSDSGSTMRKGFAVVSGVGGVSIALLVAKGASVPLASAGLLYVTVLGAGGMIFAGGVLGQDVGGARELVQGGVKLYDDLMKKYIAKGLAAIGKQAFNFINGQPVPDPLKTFGLVTSMSGGISLLTTGVANAPSTLPTPNITVTPNSIVTSESGSQAIFEVALTKRPTHQVIVNLTNQNPEQGEVTPTILVFNPENPNAWFFPIKVTVTGKRDFIERPDVTYQIITEPAQSTDPAYSGRNAADVTVVNKNIDKAGVTITRDSVMETTEDGGTASFRVVLNSRPTSKVTIIIVSNDTSEGNILSANPEFEPENWSTPRNIIVRGADDFILDGDIAYKALLSGAISTDPKYSGMDVPDVDLINRDNELPGLSINDASRAEGNSGAANLDFIVTLSTAVSRTVTVNYATANGFASAGSDYTAKSGTLTFNPGETTKTISVSVTGDTTVEGNETFVVNLSNASHATFTRSQGIGTITNDDSGAPANLTGTWQGSQTGRLGPNNLSGPLTFNLVQIGTTLVGTVTLSGSTQAITSGTVSGNHVVLKLTSGTFNWTWEGDVVGNSLGSTMSLKNTVDGAVGGGTFSVTKQ